MQAWPGGHRANPAATLRVEAVYGVSVLLSGLASLILSSKEENLLDQYYKVHIQRLLKLHQATPAPVVYFLAGCLPLTAKLHLRMFSLFGQLCRLRAGDNILAHQARAIYSSSCSTSKSWFWKIRQLCLQYDLPHPSDWLLHQPSKHQVKTMARSAVLQYWLSTLRHQAAHLSSLKYLHTNFLGLTTCHPLGCVAVPHVRWRKLAVKHVSYLGDTGWRPYQVIGLPGTRKVCVPCLSAGENQMLTRGLWRVFSSPATHFLPPELLS